MGCLFGAPAGFGAGYTSVLVGAGCAASLGIVEVEVQRMRISSVQGVTEVSLGL